MTSPASVAGRLVLGTVQFGLAYGVSHQGGAVARSEAAAILTFAGEHGIRTLDTAAAYGESESVLGELFDANQSLDIVTKTVPIRTDRLEASDIAVIDEGFHRSLVRLRRDRVSALLVHDSRDLLASGGDRLWALLETYRANGLVARIGVSVYDATEIEAVLARYPVELMQLPSSVFDQRLVLDGTLARLASRGVAVHIRSLFLQGLLLMAPDELPASLVSSVPSVQRWREACAAEAVTPLAAALAFGMAQPVEGLVIGVHSRTHLMECLAAIAQPVLLPWASLACADAAVIDPRRWRQ